MQLIPQNVLPTPVLSGQSTFEKNLPKEVKALIASFSGPAAFFEVCKDLKGSKIEYLKQAKESTLFATKVLKDVCGKIAQIDPTIAPFLDNSLINSRVHILTLFKLGSADDLETVFKKFSNLQSLTFQGSNIGLDHAQVIAKYAKNLKEIHFCNVTILLHALEALKSCPIKSLEMANDISDREYIETIAKFTQLESLELQIDVDDEEDEPLLVAPMSSLTQLKKCTIEANVEIEDLFQTLQALPLEKLSVGVPSVAEDDEVYLGSLQTLKKLFVVIDTVNSEHLAAVGRLTELTSLEVHLQNDLEEEDILQLQPLKKLEHLHLTTFRPTERTCAMIAGFHNLSTLHCSFQSVSSSVEAQGLEQLASLQNLTSLTFQGYAYQDALFQSIQSLTKLKNVTLRINCEEIVREGNLVRHETLPMEKMLQRNALIAKSIQPLHALENVEFTLIQLPISKEVFQAFGKCRHLQSLKVDGLERQEISCEEIQDLSSLTKLKKFSLNCFLSGNVSSLVSTWDSLVELTIILDGENLDFEKVGKLKNLQSLSICCVDALAVQKVLHEFKKENTFKKLKTLGLTLPSNLSIVEEIDPVPKTFATKIICGKNTTHDAIKKLCTLFPNSTKLDLEETLIQDEIFNFLLPSQSLEYINIENCEKLSMEAVRDFMAARPDVKVDYFEIETLSDEEPTDVNDVEEIDDVQEISDVGE